MRACVESNGTPYLDLCVFRKARQRQAQFVAGTNERLISACWDTVAQAMQAADLEQGNAKLRAEAEDLSATLADLVEER